MLKSISATINQIKDLGKSVLAFWRLRKNGMAGHGWIFCNFLITYA